MYVSGLDRLVEAVEVAERASATRSNATNVNNTDALNGGGTTGNGVSKQQLEQQHQQQPQQPQLQQKRVGFVCPVATCRKIFSKKYNQATHMRLHSGNRPFACLLCSRTFMWKSSLKSHARFHAKLSAAAVGNAAGPVTPLAKKARKLAPKRKSPPAVLTSHQPPPSHLPFPHLNSDKS